MMQSSGETRRENANSCLSTVIANRRALADAGADIPAERITDALRFF